MQAISKESHKQFCSQIEVIRISRSLKSNELTKMESELILIFQNYWQHLNDLREIILEYDTKKSNIRAEIKQLVRGKQRNGYVGFKNGNTR